MKICSIICAVHAYAFTRLNKAEKYMKNNDNKILSELFGSFFRIGILTFGGGLTMLPMLKYEIVQKKKWCSEEQLLDCYAVGQCTPGIIAVNTATYVGYLKAGIPGAIWATTGIVSPSILIITLIASFLRQFIDNIWIQHALVGIRGIVCALMFQTVINLAKKSLIHPLCILICIGAFLLTFFTNIPTILIVILSAIVGNLLAVKGGQQ